MATTTCGTCSALVEDTSKHDEWHQALNAKITQTGTTAARAGADQAAKDALNAQRGRGSGGF